MVQIAKQIEDCAIIKIDLLNLESSVNQPQLKSLLNSGWEVISSLPIEDQGKPFLILILRDPSVLTRPPASREPFIYIVFLTTICILLFLELYLQ